MTFLGINGGPQFPVSEAVSFAMSCKNQRKIVIAELEDAVAAA